MQGLRPQYVRTDTEEGQQAFVHLDLSCWKDHRKRLLHVKMSKETSEVPLKVFLECMGLLVDRICRIFFCALDFGGLVT